VRETIEAIEAQAGALGWSFESLWNDHFSDLAPGLAAMLEADDEIAEVTTEYIEVIRTRREILRFPRLRR